MRRPARKWLRRLGAGWVGMGLTIAASFWAGYNFNAWTGADAPSAVVTPAVESAAVQTASGHSSSATDAALNTGVIYVRRDGSALRDKPEWSGHTLTHKDRGAAVALLAPPHDGWAKVQAGDIVGWMRTSILGDNPSPKTAAR